MMKRDHPMVSEEIPEALTKAFNFEYVLKRQDLTSEEKIGYYKGAQEIINILKTWSEDN